MDTFSHFGHPHDDKFERKSDDMSVSEEEHKGRSPFNSKLDAIKRNQKTRLEDIKNLLGITGNYISSINTKHRP